MSEIHVFFFRGMTVDGRDNVGFAFRDFGPMCRHLQAQFADRDVHFHPINGMGAGSLVEMAARARAQLDQHPVWQDPSKRVHFFGHSAGGLMARMILQADDIPAGKVLSLITVSTPHHGAGLARRCIDMPAKYPISAWIMRLLGFDMRKHAHFFAEFTPENIQRLMGARSAASLAAKRVASVICALPRREWCWALKMFYWLPVFREFHECADGMIERDTQAFGEVIAELKIDHFRQVGYFGQKHRFRQMCDVLYRFFVSANDPQPPSP